MDVKPAPAGSLSLPGIVDTSQFVDQATPINGVASTDALERLYDLLDGEPGEVTWRFAGQSDRMADGSTQQWLSLSAQLRAEMPCARCDEPAPVAVAFERRFMLVADERRAEAIDEQAEEFDVLVRDRRFSLTDLLEDECLMSLPTFVSHDGCSPRVADNSEAPARNPFAALAALRNKR